MLDELIFRAETTIASLGLGYRVIEICTGDLGQSHHRSFDIEVYAPGCDQWLEVSSVSWFGDYQARRGNIRYRPAGQKGTEIVHTLNGSALAVPRVWAAIVETFHQPDGSVAFLRCCGRTRAPVDRCAEVVSSIAATSIARAPLDVGDLLPDPIELFEQWYDAAAVAGCDEPNAMTLATVDERGHPDARTVLARGVDTRGFVFYTNTESAKGGQLDHVPYATLVFRWVEVHRQVRVRGTVSRVSDADADAYFATRPRESRIGAWASAQSSVLRDRAELDARVTRSLGASPTPTCPGRRGAAIA
jgi:pyridoxamine-phosphate oxidase